MPEESDGWQNRPHANFRSRARHCRSRCAEASLCSVTSSCERDREGRTVTNFRFAGGIRVIPLAETMAERQRANRCVERMHKSQIGEACSPGCRCRMEALGKDTTPQARPAAADAHATCLCCHNAPPLDGSDYCRRCYVRLAARGSSAVTSRPVPRALGTAPRGIHWK